MNIKNIIFAFLVCAIVTAPLMGMNNPTFKEAKNAISGHIEKKYFNYKQKLKEQDLQKKMDQIDQYCTLDQFNIQKIAENNIDQGILLEQHLHDLLTIGQTKSSESIKNILDKNIDKEQKLMGLIECASFTGSSEIFETLVQYGFQNNLIPSELVDGMDDTADSLSTVKQLLSRININVDYPVDYSFNPTINDIKTIYYRNNEKIIAFNVENLNAFEVTDSPYKKVDVDLKQSKDQQENIKKLRQIFFSISLPAKIDVLLQLNDLNEIMQNDIRTVKGYRLDAQRAFGFQAMFSIILGLVRFGYQIFLENKQESNNKTTFIDDLKERIRFLAGNEQLLSTEASKHFFLNELDNFNKSVDATSVLLKALKTLLFNKDLKLMGLISTLLGTLILVCFTATNNLHQLHYIIGLALYVSLLLIGSGSGLAPLPQLYFIYQYFFGFPYFGFRHSAELPQMQREQGNIQNFIAELKSSLKKDYKL